MRFRSATQLDEFTRIINSARLLADRHALWYASEQVIRARLVGDHDQLHAAVARVLSARQKGSRFIPDSPQGRDVAGCWPPSAHSPLRTQQPRQVRIPVDTAGGCKSGPEVALRPSGREVPSVGIELAGPPCLMRPRRMKC